MRKLRMQSDGIIANFGTGPSTETITRGVGALRRSATDIGTSDWQMHSRPAGDNADYVIASFISPS